MRKHPPIIHVENDHGTLSLIWLPAGKATLSIAAKDKAPSLFTFDANQMLTLSRAFDIDGPLNIGHGLRVRARHSLIEGFEVAISSGDPALSWNPDASMRLSYAEMLNLEKEIDDGFDIHCLPHLLPEDEYQRKKMIEKHGIEEAHEEPDDSTPEP
jgi:hypothetical protein